jgi:NitT/TauT family transport system substrate-binding protein
MNCCQTTRFVPDEAEQAKELAALDRRAALKGIAGAVGGLAVASSGLAHAQEARVRLAFCGQLLCVVPYEVTRARGHFRDEGLDVELVYTRGGGQAMQALVGGAVEYAGTSFDVVIQAFAQGAPIRRFASTGRLPLFALATAPGTAEEIDDVGDLEGRTVGVSALGNADHTLLLYLLGQAGADASQVRFATLGTNLYDALRLGQIDAGMVQEPALSLVTEDGGRVIFNAMDLDDAEVHLGGPYEFMGVTVRADERDQRLDEMRRLARALAKGLQDTRTIPIEEIVAALPPELVAGGDRGRLGVILETYRLSLYPEGVEIDTDAAERVVEAHRAAGILEAEIDLNTLLDRAVLEG